MHVVSFIYIHSMHTHTHARTESCIYLIFNFARLWIILFGAVIHSKLISEKYKIFTSMEKYFKMVSFNGSRYKNCEIANPRWSVI